MKKLVIFTVMLFASEASAQIQYVKNLGNYSISGEGTAPLICNSANQLAQYYAIAPTNKNRCCQNGAWNDCISTGTIGGSGSAGQCTFWSSANNVSGDADCTWDSLTNTLAINGAIQTNTLKISTGASAGYYLQSDASGNASWSAFPSMITGSGTLNYVPKWSSSSALTNSCVIDDGTSVNISIDGTESLPAMTFGALDPNTGIWHPNADELGVSAGGSAIARFEGSGSLLGAPTGAFIPGRNNTFETVTTYNSLDLSGINLFTNTFKGVVADGRAIFVTNPNGTLYVISCNDDQCSSKTVSTTPASSESLSVAVVVPNDDVPVIFYATPSSGWAAIRCSNSACTGLGPFNLLGSLPSSGYINAVYDNYGGADTIKFIGSVPVGGDSVAVDYLRCLNHDCTSKTAVNTFTEFIGSSGSSTNVNLPMTTLNGQAVFLFPSWGYSYTAMTCNDLNCTSRSITIFPSLPYSSGAQQTAFGIAAGPDGKVYISIGENASTRHLEIFRCSATGSNLCSSTTMVQDITSFGFTSGQISTSIFPTPSGRLATVAINSNYSNSVIGYVECQNNDCSSATTTAVASGPGYQYLNNYTLAQWSMSFAPLPSGNLIIPVGTNTSGIEYVLSTTVGTPSVAGISIGTTSMKWGNGWFGGDLTARDSTSTRKVLSPEIDLGTEGSVRGIIKLAGDTDGVVQIQPASNTSNWTMTLPTDGGVSGYVLTTNGSGVLSWANSLASNAYGSFYDTTAETTATTADVAYQIPLGSTAENSNVHLNSNNIVFDEAGVYSVTASFQLINKHSQEHSLTQWIKINGNTVASSSSVATIHRVGSYIMTVNYVLSMTAGQSLGFFFSADYGPNDIGLATYPVGDGGQPAAPAVIATAVKVR